MNNEVYYNTKTIPLAERETFNNTIILLTLVKSQYYYIVGVSRPSNIIEIALALYFLNRLKLFAITMEAILKF